MGSWKAKPNSFPSTKEIETWARVAWRLKGDLMVTFLNSDLMFLEFSYTEDAKWVLEAGRRWFNGGSLQLEWWSLKFGCVKKKDLTKEAWIRVVGMLLHLWIVEILTLIYDSCGGFVAIDRETTLRTKTM